MTLHLLLVVTCCTTVVGMDFEAWLDRLTAGATRREIAQKIGMAQSTITRQLSRGRLLPETVMRLCRAYDRSPATGLIETGYLQPWDLEGVSVPYALAHATNQQLLDEILRRSDPEAYELFGAGDDDDVVDIDTPGASVSDLADRRATTPVVADGDEDAFAADSSPDEREERYERGEDPID